MKSLFIFSLFLTSSTLFADNTGLTLPFADLKHGSWASECKMPSKIKLKLEAEVFDRYDAPKKMDLLKKGTVVQPFAQMDLIRKPASIRILKNYRQFKKGEKVFLLSEGADASFRIWHQGTIVQERHTEDQEKIFGISDEEAQSIVLEQWVQIHFGNKKTGWIKLKDNSCDYKK